MVLTSNDHLEWLALQRYRTRPDESTELRDAKRAAFIEGYRSATTITTITATDIAALAGAVREAQKDYFATRSQEALQRSKALERKLDEALEAILNPQPDLFHP